MSERTTLWHQADELFPGVSVVCVIISFNNGKLKILLNKYHRSDLWMLPAGFVLQHEDLDQEANRVLKYRTGLEGVFLKQFHSFGDVNRISIKENKQVLRDNDILDDDHWFLQRYVAIGYYSFVNYSQVEIKPSRFHDSAQWFDLYDIPRLFADQNIIIDTALKVIRRQINFIPIIAKLFPDNFTLAELKIIFESVLNRTLDIRNFQRKVLGMNLLLKLNETRKNKGSKASALYSLNKERYEELLQNRISLFS